jgi:hypothetical protein
MGDHLPRTPTVKVCPDSRALEEIVAQSTTCPSPLSGEGQVVRTPLQARGG